MNPRSSEGFTFTELLTVISLIVILTSIALVTLRGSGAANLSSGGAMLASALEAARAHSVNQGQPTALVLSTKSSASPHQAFTTLQYSPDPNPSKPQWKQISPWEKLPSGVLVDNGYDSKGALAKGLLPAASPTISPALPSLRFKAPPSLNPASDYGYVIFMPNGSLHDDGTGKMPDPYVIRLVEGAFSGGRILYTGGGGDTGTALNYFEIVISPGTGRTRIQRP